MDFNKGGQEVIKRLLTAYGFKTRQALCDQLGASTSTMSTRWMRDIFPADWVIQCSIETGASLKWLSFGEGEPFNSGTNYTPNEHSSFAENASFENATAVPCKQIIDGNLLDLKTYILDEAIFPSHFNTPLIVIDEDKTYLAEQKKGEISDGTWLVEIEGKVSIKGLTRVPVGKVLVTASHGGQSFECGINDLKPIAKCHYHLLANV